MMINASEARQIAAEVVEGRIVSEPLFYLLLLAVTIVSSAIGSYISSYFKKRGEALATKADFQELLDQLRQSTHLAEEIKADIQSRHGEAATMRALLRDRTEAVIMTTFDLEAWLDQTRSRAIDGESALGASPMSKISALRDIYFPEVQVEYFELQQAYFAYSRWLLAVQQARLNSGGNLQLVRDQLEGFEGVYQPFSISTSQFRARVIASVRERGGL